MEQKRRIATIGMFDGVHRGHRFLFEQLKERGVACRCGTLVISFAHHPLATIAPDHVPPMLSTIEEREREILAAGIDECIFLDFDAEMQRLTAREFMAMIHERYAVDALILGFNNHFGSDRLSDIADYQKIGRETGIAVFRAEEYPDASSSIVRRLILDKKIEQATVVLDRFYSIKGTVIKGKQIGRTIGFPTANIAPSDKTKLIPPIGVYATRVAVPDKGTFQAMVNIGRRPTIDGIDAPISIEANIFDFEGDIYNKELTVEFIAFIRDERKFDSLKELQEQIAADKIIARRLSSRQGL